jgi:hypothetical protein
MIYLRSHSSSVVVVTGVEGALGTIGRHYQAKRYWGRNGYLPKNLAAKVMMMAQRTKPVSHWCGLSINSMPMYRKMMQFAVALVNNIYIKVSNRS